jgi:hypothetical protein
LKGRDASQLSLTKSNDVYAATGKELKATYANPATPFFQISGNWERIESQPLHHLSEEQL